MCESDLDRRRFLKLGASCAGHMSLMAMGAPLAARHLWAREVGQVVVAEPWGRLEQVGPGLWALVSTPLQGDRTTLCNGGIIAGRTGVVVVEAFGSDAGATWMAQWARELTGRWPTHAIVTHYHGDHSAGLVGFAEAAVRPEVLTGEGTMARLKGTINDETPAERRRFLADATLLLGTTPHDIDLGDRRVRVVPRDGHTASDLTIELDEPSIVWCGDLVWNGMFPNYMDATPSRLSRAVRDLRRSSATVYVPGHGTAADPVDLDRYIAVLDRVEEAARDAAMRGIPASDMAQEFTLPEALGEWILFNPAYYQTALEAWEKELV